MPQLNGLSTLANLTEDEIRSLTSEDVKNVSGYLACTITAKQIPWFNALVLGQFLLGEFKGGHYNFSGGNYLKPEVVRAIRLEQIQEIAGSKTLPYARELEQYLMIKKITSFLN